MTDNQKRSAGSQKNDELDLGQFFQLIGDGFQSLFRAILRIFVYLRKNALVLLILILVGLGIGIGFNQLIPDKLKTEVIVRPNLDSKDYLYDAVSEIQSNINARDTAFFNSIGLELSYIRSLEVYVEPVEVKKTTKDDLKYLEVLQKFENSGYVSDIVRDQMLDQGSFYHRVSFYFSEEFRGDLAAIKLMEYINSNPYFSELANIERENARYRIKQDEAMLAQIDELIDKLSSFDIDSATSRADASFTFLGGEESDISKLLEHKNRIIRDIEEKHVEIKELENPISIINFGKTQAVQKSFFGKNTVLFPTIFILAFLLIDFIKYLNRRSREMNL